MYYLVIVDYNSMAAHLTRSDCEGLLSSVVCPVQWMGMLGISVGKMKALTVTVTLLKVDRI